MVSKKYFKLNILFYSFFVFFALCSVAAEPITHTVQKGDTAYSIARKYDISVELLLSENKIADATKLYIGMKLSIPEKSEKKSPPQAKSYIVKKGDTLYSIAKVHSCTVDEIIKNNKLSGNSIKEGQKLIIYVSEDKPNIQIATEKKQDIDVKPNKIWPCAGNISYLQGKLRGVAIATQAKTAIIAIRAGTVISATPFRDFGLVAFVRASDGLVYVYGGADVLRVKAGDVVRKGATIGITADKASTTAYFFVFNGANTIDPNIAPRE